jgi:phosphoglycerol transferase MdoB-like AlkP superfamily enzyme
MNFEKIKACVATLWMSFTQAAKQVMEATQSVVAHAFLTVANTIKGLHEMGTEQQTEVTKSETIRTVNKGKSRALAEDMATQRHEVASVEAKDWHKRPLDWDIIGTGLFLFFVLLFLEVLYVHFFGMQFHVSKIFLILLHSICLSFLLSLIKYTIVRRTMLLLFVILICSVYYGEATYFSVFKMFAFWSQIVRIGDLVGIKEQLNDVFHPEYDVFFIPVVVLIVFYLGRLGILFVKRQKPSRRVVLPFKQRMIGVGAALLALIMLCGYYAYGTGDLNKVYLKNSVDYVNRYSLFDAAIFNSVQSLLPIFKEPAPSEADIEQEFAIVREVNDATNRYKDKNLIFIEGESIAPFAIDPILTPTLYRLKTEGYNFNNYYSPRANTLNSEYALMNSFYLTPEKEEEPFSAKDSMAGLFKKSKYSTQVFHDFYGTFYGRDDKMPKTGFDKFYDLGALNMSFTPGDLPNDVELFTNSFPYIEQEDRFLAYYITMSGHSGYDINLRSSLLENVEHVRARFPEYPQIVQTYLAAAMVTDQGVSKLYEQLEASGKLADTVLVFVGDHYPYGVSQPMLEETFGLAHQLDVYKTPFIIWDHSRPAQVRNDVMSNVDVLPTLANLFDLDLQYGMGQDMFSDHVADVLVEWYDFRTYSFLTPKGGYDGLKYETIGDITQGEVNAIQQRMYRREAMNNSEYLRQLLSDDPVEEPGAQSQDLPAVAVTGFVNLLRLQRQRRKCA